MPKWLSLNNGLEFSRRCGCGYVDCGSCPLLMIAVIFSPSCYICLWCCSYFCHPRPQAFTLVPPCQRLWKIHHLPPWPSLYAGRKFRWWFGVVRCGGCTLSVVAEVLHDFTDVIFVKITEPNISMNSLKCIRLMLCWRQSY